MPDQHQALYRRYRAKRFSDQRGQDHVMRALRTAVQENRVGHAYLFSGPRGTGKTSTARILAKVLNCANPTDGEPCGECDNCRSVDDGQIVDWLLELDAASNSRIDDMRGLLERLPLGTSGNRKVVILDEVHMLSAGASNALLKSLEEPPAHVVFILATTDPQKVLPTIRSRTQHYEFHLLPADELADHVRNIIADAGLDLGEDAVEYVIRQGGGSARDTLSALDQVAAMGGVPRQAEPVDAIVDALAARDAGAALVAVAAAIAAGRDPRVLGEAIMARLRNAFLAVMQVPDRHLPESDLAQAEALGSALGPAGLTRALEVLGDSLVELAKKPDPRIVLEVALVRLCRPEADSSLEAVLERLERLERAVASGSGSTPASAQPAPAASAPPTPAPTGAGPAAAARAELARTQASASPPPAPKPARQPVRKATAPKPQAPAPTPAPSEAAPARAPEPPPPAAGPAGGGAPLSADELAAAWVSVLPNLPRGAKAIFSTGRFLDTDQGAVYVLANAPTRDHCAKKLPEVESALGEHFGRPVSLRLITEAEAGTSPSSPARPVPPAAPGGPPSQAHDPYEDEPVDIHELEDAPSAATGIERLTEAFPGSELIEEP